MFKQQLLLHVPLPLPLLRVGQKTGATQHFPEYLKKTTKDNYMIFCTNQGQSILDTQT